MKLTVSDYAALLDGATKDADEKSLPERVEKFLAIIGKNRSWSLLPQIISGYEKLARERQGITEIAVTAARALSQKELDDLAKKMDLKPDKASWSVTIDPDVRGGLRLRIGDKVVRGSARDRIESLSQQLSS